jgi:hypothetical protein
MFDNIDLNERARDPDQQIVELFREWQVAWTVAGANIGPDGVDDGNANPEAMERAEEIERVIMETPSEGTVGMAVKAYMLVYVLRSESESGQFIIYGPDDKHDRDPKGRLCDEPAWLQSLLADAARFCREIEPLVAEMVAAAPYELPEDHAPAVANRDEPQASGASAGEVLSSLPLRELHGRWAAAQGEYEHLCVEIDERECDAKLRQDVEWCGWLLRSDADIEEKTAQRSFPFPNQRGTAFPSS